jgi:hypothetical protein
MLEPDLVPQCACIAEDIVKPRLCDLSVEPDKPYVAPAIPAPANPE